MTQYREPAVPLPSGVSQPLANCNTGVIAENEWRLLRLAQNREKNIDCVKQIRHTALHLEKNVGFLADDNNY